MSKIIPPVTGKLTAASSQPLEAELLDVAAVATVLKCSERHVFRLSNGGQMPSPIKLGTLVRWNRVEITEWIAAGCPSVSKTNNARN